MCTKKTFRLGLWAENVIFGKENGIAVVLNAERYRNMIFRFFVFVLSTK